ncbi:MAG: hypothetical protein IPK26_23675 [Planctomycetes bacterium]|nr:hypothetical protein [Planctomycetota bacterium]
MRLLLAFMLLTAVMAVRCQRLWAVPAFVPAIDVAAPAQLQIEGLQIALPAEAARLVVKARQAAAGHERVGPFWLGMPTFVELRFVEVEFLAAGGPVRRLLASRGRWDGNVIRLAGPVRCEGESETWVAREVNLSAEGGVEVLRWNR